MQAEAGFLGEIEFVESALPDRQFGLFEQLPHIDKIHHLAHEFSQHLELMPYQKVGEPAKLLVSVYLESRPAGGRIIAVLVRDDYPQSWDALGTLVRTALDRMSALALLEEQVSPSSIAAARHALEDLSRRITTH